MDSSEALEFVGRNGIVLETARGPVPTLVEAIVGGSVRGSWWGHPQAQTILTLTRAVRDSPDVLTCRLLGGRVTFVHRRLWPALVAVAGTVGRERLAGIREVHTPRGQHMILETPYPDWVPPETLEQAQALGEAAATKTLGPLWPILASRGGSVGV